MFRSFGPTGSYFFSTVHFSQHLLIISIHHLYIIISVIEHRFYNLSAWERREVYQRTFYSTLLVDRRTGHVCFKKSVSIIIFHVGYLLPRYYLYATSNLVLIILIKKDPSQKSINRLFRNVLSFKWYFYSLFQMIFLLTTRELFQFPFFFNTNFSM